VLLVEQLAAQTVEGAEELQLAVEQVM